MKMPASARQRAQPAEPQTDGTGSMAGICYYARRGVAIALGGTLTWYSASVSWAHFHDLLGPLAAVSAAVLLFLAGHRDGSWTRAIVLGLLGLVAAGISGTVVYQRVHEKQASLVQTVNNDNLPRVEAQRALEDARAALKTAEHDARYECASGRRKRCIGLEEREAAARQRVADARAAVVKAGAQATEPPQALASMLPFALPTWLELAAPILIGYGLAPGPRKAPEPLQPALQRKPSRKGRRKAARPKYGTAAYWLARLERDRPDLASLVRAGEMSTNMAAIKAGFRKSPVRLVSATA
jgi:hypothetical protein